MRICLCGQSSINAWRRYDNRVAYMPVFGHTPNAGPTLPRAFPSFQLEPGVPLSELDCDSAAIAARDFTRWGISPEDPLHILVCRHSRQKHAEACVIHSVTVPDELSSLFLEVEPGLCLTSPELTFLMAAQQRDLVDLVLLGYELCGCYALGVDLGHSLEARHPLTCVNDIRRLAGEIGRLKGVASARRALGFVLDGSGSPRETALVMLLCLPKRFGGFGLPTPRLNYSIEVGPDASSLWGRKNAFDLVWEDAKVVIEYDGGDGHTSFEQTERDSMRRNALLIDGYAVYTLTKRQVRNVEGFYSLVKSIAKKLGFRLWIRDNDFWAKHAVLRDRVLSKHA